MAKEGGGWTWREPGGTACVTEIEAWQAVSVSAFQPMLLPQAD